MKNLIFCLLICGSIGACMRKDSANCHYNLAFYNETEKVLYVDYTTNENLNPIGALTANSMDTKFNAGESRKIVNYSGGALQCWEMEFSARSKYGSEILNFYVFDAAVVENNSWATIVENKMWLQRYDFRLEDLQRLDWTFAFPPTEAMSGVTMNPPYGTYRDGN